MNTAISMLFAAMGNAWRAAGSKYFQLADDLPDEPIYDDLFREYSVNGRRCVEHADQLNMLSKFYRWTWSGLYTIRTKWFSSKKDEMANTARWEADAWDQIKQGTDLVMAWDPNYKAGPGADEHGAWVGPDLAAMAYYVHFENDPLKATAPAEDVVITDRLSNNLDWGTLQLLGGSHPDLLQSEINQATGTITWRMMGINLPPNKTPPEGEGWVAFSVKPKPLLPHLAVIENKASIVFDVNPPMDTNTTLVRVDRQPPQSTVQAIERQMGQTYMVRWSGNDGEGSAVKFYDVYVSEDDGPYYLWCKQVHGTSALFEGRPGHSYAFYSTATDMVNNCEAAPEEPDATLRVPLDQGSLVSFDFNGDSRIDELDLVEFANGWRQANAVQPAAVDPRFDLAPWRGQLPDIEALPDGRIDQQDAALVLEAWLMLRTTAGLPAQVPR